MQHLLYKSLTGALALTGCASLIVSGELNIIFLLPGLAIFPGYWRYLRGMPPISRWLVAALAVAEIFVLGFDALYVSRDFLIAVAHMTIVFQALKSFDFHEPWDPLQVYFMALLQLIITSDLSLSMAVGSVFVVFLFIFMAVLVVSHFMKEGTIDQVDFKRPMIIISLLAFVFTLIFFISIPRLKSGIWGRKAANGIRTVGFSGALNFGSFKEVLSDDTIAMRVEIRDPGPIPLYWRGSTLDRFDGVTWTDTFRRRERIGSNDGFFTFESYKLNLDELVEQKLILEPLNTEVVFGLGEIAVLRSESRLLYLNMPGTIMLPQKISRRYSYTAYSRLEPRKLDSGEFERFGGRYLHMPEGLERVRELAREVVSKDTALTPGEKAQLLEIFFLREFRYSLQTTPPPRGVSAMEHFLFTTRSGYCQYFASAMALMLRSIDIPSRIVTGYAGGEVNDLGNYVIVRQNNAHSWVEAFIEGRWQRYDPTPLSAPPVSSGFRLTMDTIRMQWYRYVVGFSSFDQRNLVRTFTMPTIRLPEVAGVKFRLRPVYALLLLIMVLAGFYYFVTKDAVFRRRSPESRAYLRLRSKVKRLGGDITLYTTAREVKREATLKGFDPSQVEDFIRLYEQARFDNREFDTDERKRFEEYLKELTTSSRDKKS